MKEREKDVEDEMQRRRWMTSNSRRGVGSWQGNRLKLQGSWLPSPSLWTLVDSRWSCTGWREWMLTFLAGDEWSSPQQSCMRQADIEERRCVSLTPRGLFYWDRSDLFVTLSNSNRGLHSHQEGVTERYRPQRQLSQSHETTKQDIEPLCCCAKYHWQITKVATRTQFKDKLGFTKPYAIFRATNHTYLTLSLTIS